MSPTRIATAIQVPATALEEYTLRHEQMDQEVRAAIRDSGGRNLSIFAMPEAGLVVMYVEVDDVEAWRRSAESEVTRRWWAHMADVMPTNPDQSPLTTDLPLVFHLA